ncbi:MAG: hypothetical protein HQL52_04280 [Magnetococcales bacterium]|nr:hypothetical protein [Magnetococcales bacterium]
MPRAEIVTTLAAGEKVTVIGPGTLEFQTPKILAGAKAAGAGAGAGAGAAGAGGAAVMGKGAAATGVAQGGIMTSSAVGAQAFPASLASGKVLGLNLAAMNPWVLLGIGAIGGYYFFKKKRFSIL